MYYSIYVTLLYSIISLLITFTTTSAPFKFNNKDDENYKARSGSQCFHIKGVPTLKLTCPNRELIKVQQAFYGAPPNNGTCKYIASEHHCMQLTDLHENCMGRYMCSVYVSNPFLMNCRVYANYMQVNYSCIPKKRVHNICKSTTVTTQHGFIRTPNYPDSNYTANLNCACRLKTQDDSILLHILDFSLNNTKQGVCESDFLKISGWGRKCGAIGPARLPERLELDRRELMLQFKSDDIHQARGLWMEFTGSGGGKVTMTCGQVMVAPPTSPDYETSNIQIKPPPKESIEEDLDNEILIENPDTFPPRDDNDLENMFDTYDFAETQGSFKYNIDHVQIATGLVTGVLILIAVIIIIVLVFRR